MLGITSKEILFIPTATLGQENKIARLFSTTSLSE